MMNRPLVLASTSPYRRALLERLGLPFTCAAPQVDERRLADESPTELATRLARSKAEAVAAAHPQALIIGSDQVAVIDGEITGKPGSRERAEEQLRRASGRCSELLTGLCLLDARDGSFQLDCVPFRVHFRRLDDATIARYLDREQPYDCAGACKAEGLGVTLLERFEGDDPNALIGLPLIRLVTMLQTAGVKIP